MRLWIDRPMRRWRRRAGLTFVELMIATAIGGTVSLGLASLLVMSSRMQKSIMTQQVCLSQELKSIEGLNREIRMATAPLTVAGTQGNRVEFNREGEAAGLRAFTLASEDSDILTPGDNRLEFDPNTGKSGDEIVLARNVTPLEAAGAFRYEGAMKPLQVRLRIGDPASGATAKSNAYTGPQLQGVEINISIAPRNDSAK